METQISNFDLLQLIRNRFSHPAFAVFSEVGNSVGFNTSRHADAIAVSLWPSRGLEIHGFEIKRFRSDWLKELSQPQKSQAVQKYCDRWWIVVSSYEIVREGELPPTWGLLVAKGNRLHCKNQAPKLEPEQLTHEFLAAIIRKQSETNLNEINEACKKIRNEMSKNLEESGNEILKRKVDNLETNLKIALKKIEDFEKASGITLSQYFAGRVGEAVNLLMKLRINDDPINRLIHIKKFMSEEIERINNDIDILNKVKSGDFDNEKTYK